MNVVQNELYFINKCCNHVKYSINNYYIYYKTLILIYTLILKQIFNLDVVILNTIHELTPRLAGQWLTQKPYKNHFLFRKECSQLYDFCREANKVSWTYCACIIHPRSTIFGMHNLTMSIINNKKKFFK